MQNKSKGRDEMDKLIRALTCYVTLLLLGAFSLAVSESPPHFGGAFIVLHGAFPSINLKTGEIP